MAASNLVYLTRHGISRLILSDKNQFSTCFKYSFQKTTILYRGLCLCHKQKSFIALNQLVHWHVIVSKYLTSVWHKFSIESNFAIIQFSLTLLSSFSPSQKNLIVPPLNFNIYFLNIVPLAMLFLIFAMQSYGGNVKNAMEMPFMFPHCTAVRNLQHKKVCKTMMRMPSLNQFQTN